MQPVSRHEFEGERRVVNERFSRDKEVLGKHEDQIARMIELTITTNALVQRHEETVNNHAGRISELERQPGDMWGKVKTAAVSAVMTALVGGAIVAIISNMH